MTSSHHRPGDLEVPREEMDSPPHARILVADDEAGIRRIVARALERSGFAVTCVGDGSEALARLASEPFDLLITDLIMPGTEGIETILHLRKTHPGLPIIAISGGNPRGAGDFLDMAKILGAKFTLRKPFEFEELLQTVHQALGMGK